jgi:hypothetical protein
LGQFLYIISGWEPCHMAIFPYGSVLRGINGTFDPFLVVIAWDKFPVLYLARIGLIINGIIWFFILHRVNQCLILKTSELLC